MGDITKFTNVEDAKKMHRYRRMLWLSLRDWTNKIVKWEHEKFKEIDVEEI